MTEPNNSLKGIGEALVNAGGRLGDVVGDFADRFKADSPEGRGLGDQVKQAVARARTSFSEASDADQYKRASASFAGDAESIFRDLAGSVSRAAQGTKDSAELGAARESLNSAMDQIRQAFDQSVGQIRERTEKSGTDQDKKESEGFINDMRGRLEGMISRVNEGLDSAKNSTKDSANTDAPDIIDGEVVTESDTESDTDTKNPPTGENS